ncbi:MAG TPA: type II toxin-antitoxin system PemK/MazF family toxin [Anaerolineales bacterium]|nr:type II toxin-antitoxin system PemK/MazF family toxin [Anaerolineales bacterium]
MKRGEVRWFEFQPPDKHRPVLILTRDPAMRVLNEVTIAPITSTIRGIPTEILLTLEDGMPQDCAINFDHLQTVPKRKLGRLITMLSEEKTRLIGPAVCFALGLDEYLKSSD